MIYLQLLVSTASLLSTISVTANTITTLSAIASLSTALNDVTAYPNSSYTASLTSFNQTNNSSITLLPLNKTLLAQITTIDNSSSIFEAGRQQNIYFRIPSAIAGQLTSSTSKNQSIGQLTHLALQFLDSSLNNNLVIIPINSMSTGITLLSIPLNDNSQVISLQINTPSTMCSQIADSCIGFNYNAYLLFDSNQLSNPVSNRLNAACGDVCSLPNATSSACSGSCGALCNGQQVAGADTPISRRYNMGSRTSVFQFIYETYAVKDRIRVWNGGVTPLFDSGCVGTESERRVNLTLSSSNSNIHVDVKPDCDGGTGTMWDFKVVCPRLRTQRQTAITNPVSLLADGLEVTNGATLYIDEQAQMPSIIASSFLQTSWAVSFQFTAAFSGAYSYSLQPLLNGISSNNLSFDITSALNCQVLGGDVTVQWTITSSSPQQSGQYVFKIFGKQPAVSDVLARIDSQTSVWYAKKIALQESQAKQFSGDGYPLYSTALYNGYGIFQITDPICTYNQVWNWKANVDQGIIILNSKAVAAVSWMARQRSQAERQTGSPVPVPDEQVGSNCLFSDNTATTITDAVAIKQYNGVARGNYCAWHNNTIQWEFNRLNQNNENYVEVVSYVMK